MRRPSARKPASARLVAATLVCVCGSALAGCTATPSDCNPYYPLRRGAQWVFHDTRQTANAAMERTVSVTSVEISDRVTTATVSQNVHAAGQPETSAGSATTIARCAGGAVRLSVEGAAQSSAGGQAANATIRAELPGLPPADKLIPGYQWQSEGRVETTDGGAKVVTAISRQSQVDGVFPIKVPGGEFPQALRVASIETLKLGERQAKQEIREWYVRGLGLVKRDTRLAEVDHPVDSAEELVSFTGVKPEP